MIRINFNYSGRFESNIYGIRTDSNVWASTVIDSPSRLHFELEGVSGGAHFTLHGSDLVDFLLPADPSSTEASDLRLPDLHFSTDRILVEGRRFNRPVRLNTDFRLFKRFMDGEDILPIVQERKAFGSRGVRTFGTCDFLFQFDPLLYGDYFRAIPIFAQILADHGMDWELTMFTDYYPHQAVVWNKLREVVADVPNLIVELGNENAKNGVDAYAFSPIANTVCSSGSFCDGWAPTPGWDYVTFHPRRDWKWSFTVAPTTNELAGYSDVGQRPILINEPIGAADQDEPGRRASDPALFEKMFLDSLLWAAGAVFHFEAGLQSEPISDRQRECAIAAFRGMERGIE